MRILKVLGACLMVLSGLAFLQVPPAAADDPNTCTTGNVCLWGENSYSGCRRNMSGDQFDYRTITWSNCSGFSINNGANSLTNRGATCNVVLFDAPGIGSSYVGPGLRFNNPTLGGIYQDPNLSNGGGYGFDTGSSTSNWQDKFSSHDFCR